MKSNDNTGLRRLLNATRWTGQGLASTWRDEEAFRQEALLLVILAPLGWWLGETGVERALLVGSWLLVMIVELLNSAVENVVDRVGLDSHPLSGRAKDQGSAAVFVALCLALFVWIAVLTS